MYCNSIALCTTVRLKAFNVNTRFEMRTHASFGTVTYANRLTLGNLRESLRDFMEAKIPRTSAYVRTFAPQGSILASAILQA